MSSCLVVNARQSRRHRGDATTARALDTTPTRRAFGVRANLAAEAARLARFQMQRCAVAAPPARPNFERARPQEPILFPKFRI